MKWLQSVWCIFSASVRMPSRSAERIRAASCDTKEKSPRAAICLGVRGLRTCRGRERRHHCPRH